MLFSHFCLASFAIMINLVNGLLIPSSTTTPSLHDLRSRGSPDSLAPMERQPVQCHSESDFPGHADVNYGMQWEAVDAFCKTKHLATTLSTLHDPADGRFPITYRHRMRWRDWPHRINYDFFVEWVWGCRTTSHFQSVGLPLGKGGVTCHTIMRDNFLKCNNGGVGGNTQVGCLLFTFTGANGSKCILTEEEMKLRDIYDKKHGIKRPDTKCGM
ncbi:hypothetical protein CDEST_10715 [Colletotrichum destructivum]|uniref:Uncharacterized protein n=1 Tax=Colletotrichum destructivum TaxID=34406 RepID=A0AAX4IR24_9PEZI|nr:hypothetical protein CDEST_10715 [Colletotrichum destructivum]